MNASSPPHPGGAAAPRAPKDFGGLRVVAFESRQAGETASLIRKSGGIPISAPAMREIPLAESTEALRFGDTLLAGGYDMVIFNTGVGTRYLFRVLETRFERERIVSALTRVTVVARGPKPVRALREFGVPVAITVPEPNTWREMLEALEQSSEGIPLEGARIAVQEYGVSNARFLDALKNAGARVDPVPVYRWGLPEDTRPIVEAISEVINKTADVALFTSATQVDHLLQIAASQHVEERFLEALRDVVVCSIGPVCTEALCERGIAVDFEPTRPKLGRLIGESAAAAAEIAVRKRTPRRAPARPAPANSAAPRWNDGPFMKACRRERVDRTPVWLMRQAGRYMQEYREVRARVPFIELCKRPELAAEVAVTAASRIGVDAAILFSDILLIVEPMGCGLDYLAGEGPSISRTVREPADVDRIVEVEPAESLPFVFDAVRRTRAELDPSIPLIGFSGAPFTLASYIIEGGGSKNYIATKSFMYADPGAWSTMMEKISRSVAKYLNLQIEAGCQAVQLFDSWVGCLAPDDYERFVMPHTESIFDALPKDVPSIHFGTDTATLLDHMAECGSSVLGVDHRVPIGAVLERFPSLGVQGNLDPAVLFTDPKTVRDHARRLLRDVDGRPGHVFNLGHGILPGTPVDNVIALVDAVHEFEPPD